MKTTLLTKIRTAALASLVGLGSIGAASAALPAGSASAATTVSFCFKYQNPPSFSAYANKPVYLYQVLPSGGVGRLMRSGSTNANGCGTFYNVDGSTAVAVYAYTTGNQTWEGWSQYSAPIGRGAANLGTGQVWRTR